MSSPWWPLFQWLQRRERVGAGAPGPRHRDSPNTTCFPSSQSHLEHVMKNWQPLVLGPLFAWGLEEPKTSDQIKTSPN